jgi:hypothetical protein
MSPAEDEEEEGGAPAEKPQSDGASEKQLNFIRSLQRRMTLADDELAKVLDEVCGVQALEDLGRKEASEVIDELQVRAREKGIDLDAQQKASDKQVGFMKQLKRRAHLTDDEFAALLQDRAGVTDAADVGKRDASAIIDELMAISSGKSAKPQADVGAKKAPAAKKKPEAPAKKADAKPAAKPSAPAKKKPAAAPVDDDDDRPPEKGPPPEADDFEPGALDGGPDDEDLDRDPGGDDDLPF